MSRPNCLNAKTAIVGIQGCYNFYIIKLDYCHNENTHEIVFGSILCLFVCLFVCKFISWRVKQQWCFDFFFFFGSCCTCTWIPLQ